MLNSPQLAALASLNGTANKLTMTSGSSPEVFQETDLKRNKWRGMGSNRDVNSRNGSPGYLQLDTHSIRLACYLRGMTTVAPFSRLKHGRRWCCRSLAKCLGCPNWDRAPKQQYKSWKTASISKSTRRHFRHQPRPLHLTMETTVKRERSRKDRRESGKFSPERIASTAMDGSSWPDRVGSCPSLWALFSSQVDYSLYLSEFMFHISSAIRSCHLRVQSLSWW